ncbi:hypothetical protein DFH07DRAFT_847785 [Mycena maculata]|uniref:Uncharacterized protein n=1 Tax=Mycena maculata TaxID=230809 RepID=A0AAD7MUF7_9AGAR|nr:hypothetical protein DFH07DRAFT_847785 [Mycena maculata]
MSLVHKFVVPGPWIGPEGQWVPTKSGKFYSCSPTPNDACSATLIFNGTGLQVVGSVGSQIKQSASGIVDVQLDGLPTDSAPFPDPNHPDLMYFFDNSTMAEGPHKLTISMNHNNTDTTVFLNYFNVSGSADTSSAVSSSTSSSSASSIIQPSPTNGHGPHPHPSGLGFPNPNAFASQHGGLSQQVFIPLMAVIAVLGALLVAALGYVLYLRHTRRTRHAKALDDFPSMPPSRIWLNTQPAAAAALASSEPPSSRFFEPARWTSPRNTVRSLTTSSVDEYEADSAATHGSRPWDPYTIPRQTDISGSDGHGVPSIHAI